MERTNSRLVKLEFLGHFQRKIGVGSHSAHRVGSYEFALDLQVNLLQRSQNCIGTFRAILPIAVDALHNDVGDPSIQIRNVLANVAWLVSVMS